MTIEIAIGVALGIVLAVVTLMYWRQIVSSSILLLLILLVVGLVAWLGFYFWEERTAVAAYAGNAAAVAATVVWYALPFYIYKRITKKYPKFNALIKGDAPFTASGVPLRLLVMILFALTFGGATFGAIWLLVNFSEP